MSPVVAEGGSRESRGTASMHSPGSSERHVTASRSVWNASMMVSGAGGAGAGAGGGEARVGIEGAAAAASATAIPAGGSAATDKAVVVVVVVTFPAAAWEAAREQTSLADAALNLRAW